MVYNFQFGCSSEIRLLYVLGHNSVSLAGLFGPSDLGFLTYLYSVIFVVNRIQEPTLIFNVPSGAKRPSGRGRGRGT